MVSALLEVIKSTGSTQLCFNHLYDPISLVRDHRLKEVLSAQGVAVRSFNADLLYEPWEVHDKEGRPFTTFAGFWHRCLSMPYDPESPLLPPKRIVSGDVSRCAADALVFEDESEKGSNALLARAWSPGWSSGGKALTTFLNGPLIEYSKNRRKANSATTLFLSPHLHFGEVSVRKVFHLVRIKQVVWANEGNKAGEESVNSALFLMSIGLREYSRYLSFNHPHNHEKPLLAHLKYFPWVVDEGYFKSWRQGRTGYPLVDAGMRELWATGWLHDRIRVVVSSFFVKVLQFPWIWGMKYFWDTLLDGDLECDALGWQYITGTLPDGRDFDRIDNPQFEGYKFDPNGEYVRRWLQNSLDCQLNGYINPGMHLNLYSKLLELSSAPTTHFLLSKFMLQRPGCKKHCHRCGSMMSQPTEWKRDLETHLNLPQLHFLPIREWRWRVMDDLSETTLQLLLHLLDDALRIRWCQAS